MRTALLACGLAATLAAAGLVGGEERSAPVEPVNARVSSRTEPPQPALTPQALDLEKLARPRSAKAAAEMFGAHSWTPAPPPPEARPTAPPAPPPLPFAFFGRMTEGRETTVFLARNDEVFTARAGDTIAEDWRVEEIGEAAIVLTYVPLSARQVLDIGAIN